MDYGKRFTYEKKGFIGEVRLANPPLNLVDELFFMELESIQKEIFEDKELRAVTILAKGKAFSAGIDLNYLKSFSSRKMKDKIDWLQGLYSFWQKLPIPVVAGVHGYCLGSAVELIAGVDIRVTAQNAVYQLPEVQLGLAPDMGGTTRITKLIGMGQAKKMIVLCEKINAEEAYRIGLVEYLTEADNLEKYVTDLANQVASYPPSAVRFSKKGVNIADENTTEASLQFEQAQSIYCLGTEDMREGITAILEKRKPSFKDE